jgi:putative ABC transport system substrate-binding protein
MQRREALAILAGAAVAWPFAGRSQQKATPVIGILSSGWPNPNLSAINSSPLAKGLNETGYIAGRSVLFERRWAEGRYDRLPALAAELVGRNVDLIVTFGGTAPALAAKSATTTIPIVSPAPATRLRLVWSPVLPDRAETSRASASLPTSWRPSGST